MEPQDSNSEDNITKGEDGMIVYTNYVYEKKKVEGKKFVNEFEIFEKLGSGSFWNVFLVKRDIETEEGPDTNYYVFKEGQLSQLDAEGYEQMFNNFSPEENINLTRNLSKEYFEIFCSSNEIEKRVGMKEYNILKYLNHKHISRLYECIICYEFDKIVFVMEYCDLGTLMKLNDSLDGYDYNLKIFDCLIGSENDKITIDGVINFMQHHEILVQTAKVIFKQLAEAIKYLHDKNIAHRDIKPDNIMMKSSDKAVKLIDFSIALKASNKNELIESDQGTLPLLPPEVINHEPHSPFCVDIYNYGATFYVFLFNRFEYIFEGREDVEFLKTNYPQIYDLLYKILKSNAKDRPNINDIIEDNFFK